MGVYSHNTLTLCVNLLLQSEVWESYCEELGLGEWTKMTAGHNYRHNVAMQTRTLLSGANACVTSIMVTEVR